MLLQLHGIRLCERKRARGKPWEIPRDTCNNRLGELSNARGKAYVHAKHIIAFCSRNLSRGPFRHKVLGNVLVVFYDVRQENI